MKSITRILHLPPVVQPDCYEATRILFAWKLNKNNNFIQQLGNVTSPLCQRSAILKIIPWTQNAYSLLYQPRHRDASSSSIYALIWMQTVHPCGPADTEDCMHFAYILRCFSYFSGPCCEKQQHFHFGVEYSFNIEIKIHIYLYVIIYRADYQNTHNSPFPMEFGWFPQHIAHQKQKYLVKAKF